MIIFPNVILNGVKNLGRGVISYLADPPPQTLRFAQGDSEALLRQGFPLNKEGFGDCTYFYPSWCPMQLDTINSYHKILKEGVKKL